VALFGQSITHLGQIAVTRRLFQAVITMKFSFQAGKEVQSMVILSIVVGSMKRVIITCAAITGKCERYAVAHLRV
jgi:hypothetical protein